MTALGGFWCLRGGDSGSRARGILEGQRQFGEDAPLVASFGSLAMGRRFSPLLPEDVHDRGPQRAQDDRFGLVADVRLDNRNEIAAALGIAAADLHALCDAALLLRAWAAWETETLDRILGDFAFALWDRAKRRLVLARDFLGQKPLCYAAGADFFAFASMPSGLQTLAQVPAAPATDQMTQFLSLSFYGGSASFFDGIHRVMPGHFAVATAEGVAQHRYWNPSLDPLLLDRPEAYIGAVREQLERAVAVRLRGGEAGIGAHLSAGLDSSAVTACAARLVAPARLSAFTAAPPLGARLDAQSGLILDESRLAAVTAAGFPQLDHVVVRDGGADLRYELDRGFNLYQRPIPNLCNYGWTAAINDAARTRGVRVLLTGDMGNLGFSHSGIELLPQLLRSGSWIRLAREVRTLAAGGERARSLALASVAPLLPASLWRWFRRWRGRPIGVRDYSLVAHPLADPGVDYAEQPLVDAAAARLRAYRGLDPGNFNKGFWAGWRLDVRDPTADRRLVELCLRIPSAVFLMEGVPRGLARRVVSDWLPAALVAERRRGHQGAAWQQWLDDQRPVIAEEVARLANVAAARETIDLGRAEQLLRDWPGPDAWSRPEATRLYRSALLRSVSAGHFARRAARSNA